MNNRQDFERWEIIPDFIDYEVSNFGEVRSYKTNRNKNRVVPAILKKGRNSAGYYTVSLHNSQGAKTHKIHSLVACCFLPSKTDDKLIVDHKDNDRLNNKVDNLQYITRRLNASKDRRSKTGITGVFETASKKFMSHLEVDGKKVSLGIFKTQEQARDAYQNKLKSL